MTQQTQYVSGLQEKSPDFQTSQWIGGAFVKGLGGPRPIVEPATGQVIAAVNDASPDQALAAIAAAKTAQPAWAARAPIERARLMREVSRLIRRDAERLAELVVREQGKPIKEARGEIAGAAEFMDYFAEFARRLPGEILPSDHPGEQVWVRRAPVGVVAAIIPWNYPAALICRKMAPALITGNAVVVKPHEMTPLSGLAMAQLFEEAGLPSGLVNMITGAGDVIGETLTTSPDVNLVTMTGSVPVGRRIMSNAAENLTTVSLELGGKAAFIVMADADLDLAVQSAVTSRFMNCGQTCICNERTLVQRPIYDAFVEKFVAATQALKIGDPLSPDTDIGPKVSEDECAKVEQMVQHALAQGARAVIGGRRLETPPTKGGFWFDPTVLVEMATDADIMRHEIFGPVVPIVPFDSFDDAVAIANEGSFGLSSYIFTRDFQTIMDAIDRIEVGEVYVNRAGPESVHGFHGGWQDSGVAGDDGVHGLEVYMRKKTVYVNYSGKTTVNLMPY
jgi:lactaldehyde dehydrogenase/glycolaldehyde dehydrogenase